MEVQVRMHLHRDGQRDDKNDDKNQAGSYVCIYIMWLGRRFNLNMKLAVIHLDISNAYLGLCSELAECKIAMRVI